MSANVETSVFAAILGRTGDGESRCVLGDRARTYGELRSESDALATRLASAGCGRGSRVGICLDQGFEYLVSLLAVRKCGGVAVLMAPDWTDREKDRVLQHAECRLVLADTPVLGELEPGAVEAVAGLDALLLRYDVPETEAAGADDAVIIYTSGTTGLPKGVVLTESGVSANVRAVADYLGLTASDAAPVFTPTCYAYSLSQNLTHLWVGAALLPLPSGLMFPQDIVRGIASHRLTGVSATPTAFRILSQLDLEPGLDLGSVRYAMTGGQYLDSRLVGLLGTLFPNATVVNMYGASENSPRISYLNVDGTRGMDEQGYFAVGTAVEGTRIRVEGSARPGDGVTGEISISGTSLMRAYWKDPASTAERLIDGWFHTRDLGYFDRSGLLHLTGRQSTIINIGNEKVSPEEVEKVLAEMPGVAEAAVYGVPDPLLGEIVHAQVVVVEGAALQLADVQRHCRERISGYKVPRRIHVVDALPKTLYGKIDRARLRDGR